MGQAASRLQPQGLYGVPPLQTPGFMSGSSDVIEELLKEMANSNAGPQRSPRVLPCIGFVLHAFITAAGHVLHAVFLAQTDPLYVWMPCVGKHYCLLLTSAGPQLNGGPQLRQPPASNDHAPNGDMSPASAIALKDRARVAGLPAPPHPSKLPTSSSIFESMMNGGAGRSSAFGDLTGSLPPYLGPNGTFPGMGSASDGLYGAGSGTGLGEHLSSRIQTHAYVEETGLHRLKLWLHGKEVGGQIAFHLPVLSFLLPDSS